MNLWVLKRKIHPSWLISIFCMSFSLGVFFAGFINYQPHYLLVLLSIFLLIVVFSKRYIYTIPLIILAGMVVGLSRGSVATGEMKYFTPIFDKNIVIEGRVKDDVDIKSPGEMSVRLEQLKVFGKSIPGSVWITATPAEIKRGDLVVVNGKLKEGFGNYSGTIYRASIQRIIHPNPGDIGRVVRDWFSRGIKTAIPEPQASLGIGYLVGQRRSLPADLVTALQVTGLTHIVVASGYNLTILVRFIRRIFMRISKYSATFMSFLTIFAFIMITGLSPSMIRAGLVAGLSLMAWYYGRKFHPIVLLSVAIAITLFINPSYVWGDLGWQLSFAAFAGVMIIAPLGQRYFFGDKKPKLLRQILGETISAQIATAPIIIFAFGQISNVAVITNLLVLPLIPIAMLMTFIAGLGGLFLPSIAVVLGYPAMVLLGYSINVINYFASFPWASSVFSISIWGVLVIYLIITAACLYMWGITKYNLRETNLVE